MSTLKSVFSLLCLVTMFGVIVSVNSPKTNAAATATAGSAPVTVVNTPLPVQGTVTGNVAVTGTVNAVQSGPWSVGVTGNVGVTGTVPAVQSGVWNVGITGTPSVELIGTPSVNVAGGTVKSSLPTLTKYQEFAEQSLDPGSSKDYFFDAPMNINTILVCTHDDIELAVITNGVQGITNSPPLALHIGRFDGNSNADGGVVTFANPCQIVKLGMLIPAKGFNVLNLAVVTHATFNFWSRFHKIDLW